MITGRRTRGTINLGSYQTYKNSTPINVGSWNTYTSSTPIDLGLENFYEPHQFGHLSGSGIPGVNGVEAEFDLDNDHLDFGFGTGSVIDKKGGEEWGGHINYVKPHGGIDVTKPWQQYLNNKYGAKSLPLKNSVMAFSARVLFAFVQLVATLHAVANDDDGRDEPRILEEFDIPVDGDMVLAPVTVGGATYRFSIDTGCSRTSYDELLRPLLGKSLRTVSADSPSTKFRADLFAAPVARLGRLSLHPRDGNKDPLVACVDLSHCRGLSEQNIRGLVGREFLKRYVVRFDFDRGKHRGLNNLPIPKVAWTVNPPGQRGYGG